MSYPRCVVAGTTYLITRRTEGRRFYFRPDPEVRALFDYCLAEAAAGSGCLLHGWCLMSNHFHLVLTDTKGRLPEFMQRFCRHLALGIARLRGHQGSVFERRSYSAVTLETNEAIIDKLAYTYCNPASAHLVHRAAQWPGALSTPADLGGRPRQVQRPPRLNLFKSMTSEATLRVCAPPHMEELALAKAVQARIEQREAELSAEPLRRVLGVKRALQTNWQSAPKNPTPLHQRRPHFAAITREGLRQAARKLRDFRRAYREAWLQLTQGIRDALFPHGTWRLQQLGLATVATVNQTLG